MSEDTAYSYRSASTGGSLLAWFDGIQPARSPVDGRDADAEDDEGEAHLRREDLFDRQRDQRSRGSRR